MIVVYQWGVNGRSHRYRHGSAFRSLGGTPPYKKVENPPPPDLYTQSYRQRERERELLRYRRLYQQIDNDVT